MEKVKMKYTIECKDESEGKRIAEKLHDQLKGNYDYQKDNIILNMGYGAYGLFAVCIYIFNECIEIPELTL